MSETTVIASETEQTSLEIIDQAVNSLASAYHEDWRKTRLQQDGTFEPREKETKDEAWISAHGTKTVDIANTSYEELPSDWQAENKAAAEVVVDYMLGVNGNINLADESERSRVGSVIHEAWLSRNPWAADGELAKPFDQLDPIEQAKDIRQVELALETFNQ